MEKRIEKWKVLHAANDPQAGVYLREITEQAKAEGKLDQMKEVANYLMQKATDRMNIIEETIRQATLHEQLGSITESINLAYIARTYFGKTRQWLYQRLKGQMVNGRPAAFTDEEMHIFTGALHDIGNQLINVQPQSVH